MTKTKIALAAALIAATSSAALAQGNRVQHHRHVHPQSAPLLQQRDVALPTEPTQGNSVGPFYYNWSGPTTGGM